MALYKRQIYDPGQFRHRILFVNQVSTPDDNGGVDVTLDPYFSTYAVQESIREGSQLAIAAGVSYLNDDRIYVIRDRCAITPEKNTMLTCEGHTYTIMAIVPINQPVEYLKLLCKKAI